MDRVWVSLVIVPPSGALLFETASLCLGEKRKLPFDCTEVQQLAVLMATGLVMVMY